MGDKKESNLESEFYKLSKEANNYNKKEFNRVLHMPALDREPDYVVKTRPAMWENFKLGLARVSKENKIK